MNAFNPFLPRALLLCAAVLSMRCQASPLEAKAADSDFIYQGEFAGKAGADSAALGVQVVAKGGGRFTAAFLAGGLPGAGWDTAGRSEQGGSLQSGKVVFPAADPAKQYEAAVSADGAVLSGKTPKGEAFSLQRTVRQSPTLGSFPPAGSNASILFDGKDLSAFVKGSAVMDSGLLLPTGSASSGAITLKTFGDFTLHLEFLEPFMPADSGQQRGNSGVYLQGRYELQILDSFGLNILRYGAGPATQECGAFYQLVAPRLNMSLPPLSWQTYDVEFTKAKFDAQGAQSEPAMVTVRLNGVLIHDHQKLLNATLLGDAVTAENGPLRFQAHGDPVHYRNIWVVEGAGTGIKSAPRIKPGKPIDGRQGLSAAAVNGFASVSGRRAGWAASPGLYVDKNGKRLLLHP